MGCDDYYDPARDRQRDNTRALMSLGFTPIRLVDTVSFGVCATCYAMVYLGDLSYVTDVSAARAHREWHNT